ncbi:hypothetical protein F511_38318 [Dorcoceras hygrometricum]|uniref:Uncharacterized protein n=1 Tax=Dorcoceras hygrometricum TaxID=472368 RepID=A0A2Z7A8N7_9LAMI|nr:hypothetical protein F511_38318 [Dorcoceras hygrometricum]
MRRRFEKASITHVVTNCESFPCAPAGFSLVVLKRSAAYWYNAAASFCLVGTVSFRDCSFAFSIRLLLLVFNEGYCSPSFSIAISRRLQPLFLTFLVALKSLRLALPIDTSLEARSNELRNPVGPARSCVVHQSNAIIGAVTTGYECLPPSCDGLTGPDDHGPMISRLIDRALLEKSAVGSCVCWLVGTCWFGKLIVSTGFVGGKLIVLISVVASAIYRKAWSSNYDINSILSKYFPRLCSSFRTLEHCSAVSFSGDFPAFPVVVLLVLLPESSGFPCGNQRVLIIAQKYKGSLIHVLNYVCFIVGCFMNWETYFKYRCILNYMFKTVGPKSENFTHFLLSFRMCLGFYSVVSTRPDSASVTADLMEVRKEVKALDAKVTYLDGQVAAIRSELFDFQAKVAENYLNLSTQIGDLVDYIRGGDAKKGEGSSSRPQPHPDDQGGGSGGRTTDIVDRFSGSMSREDRGRGRSGERRSSGNRSGHSNRRRYDSDERMDLGPSLIPRRSAKFWCTGKD